MEILVTTYKNISHNPESPDIPWGADLSYTPTLLRESINRTPSGCTSNWDSAVIHTILTKYNKTDHTHLKLINILLSYFPDTNKISAHLPYEIEPPNGNVYTVNYLYYMGIRPNPIPASILNVKLLEVFINHIHDILGPINIPTSLKLSYTPNGCDNETFEVALGCKRILDPTVNKHQQPNPNINTEPMQDNLLALSIRTHNMNILHPTNISYHITKYLIYHINQNKLGPVIKYLDNAPNPFILGLLTLPIRYTVTPENHTFNFILLINYLAKIYDLITTEQLLFQYLITPFNTSTFQHSFHSILYTWDIVLFLINSQEHPHIKECRPESYFPGIYDHQELLDYFTEFINTKEPPKKKENTNRNTLQHLTD
jgi:hypothetical protein